MKLFIVTTLLVLLSVTFCDGKPTKPGCANPVNCFVNPCQFASCNAYPDARCVADYCGGCFARWYSAGQLVDCNEHNVAIRSTTIKKEPKCQTVYCFVDPCAFAKCEKHPKAVCKANYCGGCNAWFYLDNERVSCN